MSNFKVGDVVQIHDVSGFEETTIQRFKGRCCRVESLYPGCLGYNAHIRIIGRELETFSSLVVRTSRLERIPQTAKGPQPCREAVKAPGLGPVPVDDWTYNPTTFAGLAPHEVARVISAHGYVIKHTYIIKDDEGFVWLYNSLTKEWKWAHADRVVWLHHSSYFTFVTATEYPAFPFEKERGEAINETR